MTDAPDTIHKAATILAVDDSPTQLAQLRFLLEESGFSVVAATNGREALEQAKANPIDLVVSDIVMPEMDGYALCKALRSDETLRHLPVMLLTSLTDPRDVIRGLESGANNFICKPYDDRALLARARNVLANEEIRRSSTAEMGISIFFAGQRFFITADRLQILDLLLSTYENAVDRNGELLRTRDELRVLNEQLEARVAERTAALEAEVAGRKKSEERERHLNRVLRAIRNINRLIVEQKDPARLIDQACQMLVEARGYRAAWIALEVGGAAPLVAQAGWGEAFEPFGRHLMEGKLPTCWSEARRAESGVAVLEPHAMCSDCPLGPAYASELAAIAPVAHGKRDYGTLGICLAPGMDVDDDEMSLLVEVAADIGLALHAIETERRRSAFAQIVASSQDAMALIGREFVYQEANPSYARMVGRDEGEIIGKRVPDVLGEDFFANIVKPNLQRCFDGETVRFEAARRLSGDGSGFVDAQFSPCLAADGTISAATVSVRDITERKRSQDRDRLSRSVLELLNCQEPGANPIRVILELMRAFTGVEAAGIRLKEGGDFPYYETHGFPDHFLQSERSLCSRDKAGNIVRDAQGNPVLECMCGTVLSGRADPKLPFFTEGGSFWSNGTTELLASTTEEDRQARTRNGCNSEGYESVALIPLRAGREILGLLQLNDRRLGRFTADQIRFLEGLGSNIGLALARTQAEAQVEYLSRFPSENPSPVLRMSADGTLLYANPSAGPLLQFWGCAVGDRLPADWVALVAEAMVTGTRREIEVDCAGRSFAFEVSRVETGSYVNAYGHDTTERKRAKAERENLEAQLRVSQKIEAIGRLAGGVAHDFNNLLCVIQSYTGFALDTLPAGDSLAEDLREVSGAADRAAALTRQLLAFSRKQILQPVDLSLNDIATGVEKMLRRILGEDIDFAQRLAPDLGVVRADPGQMEQVLMNLVVNARDAMPAGGMLTIETSNVEVDKGHAARHLGLAPGSYVLLAVTDTGCGMNEETKVRLFEPFFTTKGKGKGTGLGLSTVYGIVKQSGGNIWVYSEPGKGTTFKVYLPRELMATATAPKPPAAPKRVSGTETILIVEDEAALLKVAKRTLSAAGYTVLTATSGADSLLTAAAHQGDIDLLLTDVVMPGMSGRVVAEALSKTHPKLKVVFMSGYTDNAIVHHGVLDAGTQFLGKPFSPAELARKVRDVLDAPAPDRPS